MYWMGSDYDRMARLAIDIFVDYGIRSFPIDEKEICRKLGLKLVPYSAYPDEKRQLLVKKSEDAFFVPATRHTPVTIFYNDRVDSYERQRYSIFHEIKHYVNNDTDDDPYSDDMADYFARYFMAPTPYLIQMGIDDELTIISNHGMSMTAAWYALKNVRNRKAKYGTSIFEYEKPLIDLLCPDDCFSFEESDDYMIV